MPLTDDVIQASLQTALGADAVLLPGYPQEPPGGGGTLARWWQADAQSDYEAGLSVIRWQIEIALSVRGRQYTGDETGELQEAARVFVDGLDRTVYGIVDSAFDLAPEPMDGYAVGVVVLTEHTGLQLG